MTVSDRTCVFVGATGRIGADAVKMLCSHGMNVAMVTHNQEAANAIIQNLGEYADRCVAFSNDKGDAAVFADVKAHFGSVDVIVHKSGGFDTPKQLEQITSEQLSRKLTHHIVGAFEFIKAALPYLEESSAPRIILTASAGAQDGFKGENLCDSTARGGIISMTYALAKMLAEKKITVNCIAASGLINDHPPKNETQLDSLALKNDIPLKRIGKSEEFGTALMYLASKEAGFVTGQIINLSGGLHIG